MTERSSVVSCFKDLTQSAQRKAEGTETRDIETERQRGPGDSLLGEACLAWIVFCGFGIGRKRRRAAALHAILPRRRNAAGGSCCAAQRLPDGTRRRYDGVLLGQP